MRRATDRMVYVCVSPAELAAINELGRAMRIRSTPGVIREALRSVADEMGLELPDDVFAFRKRGRPEKEALTA